MGKKAETKRSAPRRFRSEQAERAYWESHDSSGVIDWSRAQHVRLPKLKPSSTSISLRLPVSLLDALRIEANRRDVPYQSLIKIWLAERVPQVSKRKGRSKG